MPNIRDMELNPRERVVLIRFVEEVERMAEDNMIKTHKLEGSHYAAMKRLMQDLKIDHKEVER